MSENSMDERQHDKPLAESAEGSPAGHLPGERPADPASADDVLTHRVEGHDQADARVLEQSRRRTRRAFVGATAAAAAGFGFYRYLDHASRLEMQPWPIRDAFQFNAALSHDVFDRAPLAPTYPQSRSENLRVNGVLGLKLPLALESWRLQVVGARDAARHPRYVPDVTAWEYRYSTAVKQDEGHDSKTDPAKAAARMAPEAMQAQAMEDENHTGRKPRGKEESGESDSTLLPGTPGLLLTFDDLRTLPRHELVTQFKCIEGWSQIVHWAGYRMADFLKAYPPADIEGKPPRYVYMETPDGDYYVGYELRALEHPQALLVTEMMGAPLTQPHGSPLRLHLPTHYGYKQIKRIALIAYTNDKPDDYWTKLGYDWNAAL